MGPDTLASVMANEPVSSDRSRMSSRPTSARRSPVLSASSAESTGLPSVTTPLQGPTMLSSEVAVATSSVHPLGPRGPSAPSSPSTGGTGTGSDGNGEPRRRTPIKHGYLFKQSSGKWKRRRWNQRWFVFDSETGILKYFRHASLPEAVPLRLDTHGSMQLKERGAFLVIQGDLPRGVPTPFCFTVSDGSREFRICADNNRDFKEWTNAISAVVGPKKQAQATPKTSLLYSPTSASISAAQTQDQAYHLTDPACTNEGQVVLCHEALTTPDPVTLASTMRRLTCHGTLLVLLLNPIVVVIRFGSITSLILCGTLINALLVWALWFRPSTKTLTHETKQSVINSTHLAVEGTPGQSVRVPTKHSDLDLKPTAVETSKSFSGMINGMKVQAGSSILKVDSDCATFPSTGCWAQVDATRFKVRQGPNYRKTKLKAPSTPALLELVAIDIFRSDRKIDNVGKVFDLHGLSTNGDELDLFIVNCQVPSYQPSNPLWGEKQGDGQGFNFITYFAIPKSVRSMMSEENPTLPAVKLLKSFMNEPSSVRDRFKAIGIVVNPQEQRLGRTERHLLETYNGQPILTRPQHRFYRGDNYFEVDVDAHEFNYVARKGLAGVSDHFRNMIVDFGFVLEGQDDAELPEQILGSVRLCKIDVREVPQVV